MQPIIAGTMAWVRRLWSSVLSCFGMGRVMAGIAGGGTGRLRRPLRPAGGREAQEASVASLAAAGSVPLAGVGLEAPAAGSAVPAVAAGSVVPAAAALADAGECIQTVPQSLKQVKRGRRPESSGRLPFSF